jgi:hypothetical protein
MVYEARQSVKANYILAALCLLLSLIGFTAAGIIPSASTRDHGAYPLVGWTIVAACFAAAFVFLRRVLGRSIEARIDEVGVYAPRFSPEPVPWDRIGAVLPMRVGVQRIVRFALVDGSPDAASTALMRGVGAVDRGMGFGDFGINATYLDPGFDALVAAVRHYRPGLIDGSGAA